MALINCTECEAKISDKAPACIHCGNPITMPEPIIPEPIMFADLVDECGGDVDLVKSTLMTKYNYDDLSAGIQSNFIIKYNDWRESIQCNVLIKFEEDDNGLKECTTCKKRISPTAEQCPHCGEKFEKRCPKCKSTDIIRIDGLSKGVSAALFGVFSANTVLSDYQCRKCKEKFK
ncbi:MAG: hypothetical protein FWG83_03450 [Oscillospiraceae bacterium]|nr:hypothetical protein [Oscillospiraceae bacterium]